MDRANCPMRHENGNCLPCGGFCTAVNDPICEALHNAFKHGESEERDRLELSMVETNAKYQERQLEILRNIYEKVTGDTVNVVRCHDCKHFTPCEEVEGVSWTGFCNYGEFHTDEDDFCSRSERKDEGDG